MKQIIDEIFVYKFNAEAESLYIVAHVGNECRDYVIVGKKLYQLLYDANYVFDFDYPKSTIKWGFDSHESGALGYAATCYRYNHDIDFFMTENLDERMAITLLEEVLVRPERYLGEPLPKSNRVTIIERIQKLLK